MNCSSTISPSVLAAQTGFLYTSGYVCLLWAVISFLTHVAHMAICKGKLPSPLALSSSQGCWTFMGWGWGTELCLGLGLPLLGGKSITFFFQFSKSIPIFSYHLPGELCFTTQETCFLVIVTARIYRCKIPIAFQGNSEAVRHPGEITAEKGRELGELCCHLPKPSALILGELACHGQSLVVPLGLQDSRFSTKSIKASR